LWKFVLASALETIEGRFNSRLGPGTIEIPRMYSVGCGDSSYVITSGEPHVIQVFKFGTTPFYSETQMDLINARAEGDKNLNDDPCYNGSKAIFLKPAFRKPVQFQRCIVIADAYYEQSDKNIPYLVFLQNRDRPFRMFGIYDQWKDPQTKEDVFAAAVVTTTANRLLQSIGAKRMPVILSRSAESRWLKHSSPLADVLRLLNPYPYDKMNAYPVSDMIERPYFNDPSLLNPVGEKLVKEAAPLVVTASYKPHKMKTQSDKPWFKENLESG
jgi:putative SOS response-associated peptidase YedK